MRRRIVSILLLFVFLSIQYGKVANYLYCKWQAEVVRQLEECGCESHLVGIFSEKLPDAQTVAVMKELVVEYNDQLAVLTLTVPSSSKISSFPLFDSPVHSRTIAPGLRPPSA